MTVSNSALAYSPDAATGAAPALLAVRQVRLNDFRNYRQLRLDCGLEPVVLVGPNGAGKTNLLEALSFLAPGRGLRRARLDEVTRRPDGASWAVAATVDTPEGRLTIGTGLEPARGEGGMRRVVRIDGRPVASQTALGLHVAAVWLTPQLDRLFLDGPGERRRFLDRLVTALHPEHAGDVAAYENALRQRSRLLGEGKNKILVQHKPVGPCLLITPWNFPLAIPLWKAAPALAFGNTVVLKPAEMSSYVATLLAETAAATAEQEPPLRLFGVSAFIKRDS